MAILTILQYPDERLHKVAKRVEHINDATRKLVRDMAETMYSAPGVGLAATQVDKHIQLIVIDVSEMHDDLKVFINPELLTNQGEKENEEGCLSVPGIYENVTRAERITVRALDEHGKPFTVEAEGLLAVCIQHEMDHLQGHRVRRTSFASQTNSHPRQAKKATARDAVRPISVKIIFAGTPEFAATALAALVKEHQIVAVLTQPDRPSGRGMHLNPSPVKQLALQYGLPVLQPISLKTDEAQQDIVALDADVMVVAAYGLILPKAVLHTPRLGCLNIHASLLPRWRGAAPIQRAILAGDAEDWCHHHANG